LSRLAATEDATADGMSPDGSRDLRHVDEDCYSLALLESGVQFHANYVRRDRHETFGELVVQCDHPRARTVEGNVLSRGTFNFSSPTARKQRAQLLGEMSRGLELDWLHLLEELCVKVLAKHSEGEPAVLLRDIPRPPAEDTVNVEGLTLLKRHGVVLFGDGGSAKSYLALFLAGRLAQQGYRVALFDWELAGEDHRERLERLFGPDMPAVWYRRCTHPLVVELDGLRRFARDARLDYIVYDSVAFAAHDKTESADSAIAYFRAVRQIGPGSLHVAHITKGGDANTEKPFGSTFWHNSARATFYVERVGQADDGHEITIRIVNKKANLDRLQPTLGYQFRFNQDRTLVLPTTVADSADPTEKEPLWRRMRDAVRRGPKTVAQLAEELRANAETLDRTIRRKPELFTRLTGADGVTKIALLEQESVH
jgi:hypothetical protein